MGVGKSASVSHSRPTSLVLDKDVSKLLDVLPPWSRANKEKEKERTKTEKTKDKTKFATVSGKENVHAGMDAEAGPTRPGHARSQSQPKLQIFEGTLTSASCTTKHRVADELP